MKYKYIQCAKRGRFKRSPNYMLWDKVCFNVVNSHLRAKVYFTIRKLMNI